MTRNLHASRRSCNLPTESRLLVLFLSPIANTKPAPKFLTVLYFPKAPLSKVTINYAPMQLFQRYCQKPATMHSTQWKYQNSAQIQYVFNFFPLLNSPSIPLPNTLPFSIPKAVPSLKHTFFSRQMCMHCLLTFTTVFLAAWCALVFLNSSPLQTVSFYHVYRSASMFLICSMNNFILHGYWHAHCFSFALPYKQLHFIMFIKRPWCFWFLSTTHDFILSWLPAGLNVFNFLSQWRTSVCCVYWQASTMRDLRVFTDFLSILEVLFSRHCRSMCMLITCVTITSSTLSFGSLSSILQRSLVYSMKRTVLQH